MSGIFTSIINTSRSLNALSRSTEIAGKNLANINNVNYAKQRADLVDLGTVNTGFGTQSLGVDLGSISDTRDKFLDNQILREAMASHSLESRDAFNSTIEIALGEDIDRSGDSTTIGDADGISGSTGLSKSMDDFFNSMHELSANPSDPTLKRIFIEKSRILTDKFNTVSHRLDNVKTDIETQISSDILNANQAIDKIANLNRDISRFETNSDNKALELRSERQQSLEKLAEFIDFTVVAPDPGAPGGDLKIQVTKADNTTMNLVDGRNVLNTLSYSSDTYYAGSPAEALDLQGGSLHGLAQNKSSIVSDLETGLDTLAQQMITSTNAAYPGDFFDASAGNFNAANITLDSALDETTLVSGTDGPGSNDILLSMIALQDQSFSTPADSINGTFRSHYSSVLTSASQEISSINSQLSDQELIEDSLKERRISLTGVSLDEETADLLRFQRAFQASAKVISILDSMLNTIVTGLV